MHQISSHQKIRTDVSSQLFPCKSIFSCCGTGVVCVSKIDTFLNRRDCSTGLWHCAIPTVHTVPRVSQATSLRSTQDIVIAFGVWNIADASNVTVHNSLCLCSFGVGSADTVPYCHTRLSGVDSMFRSMRFRVPLSVCFEGPPLYAVCYPIVAECT